MSTPPRPAAAGDSDRVAATDVERAHLLVGEQVHMLYERLWQPVLCSVLAAVLLVTAMWPVLPAEPLLGWLGAVLVVSGLRLWLARRFQELPGWRRRQRRWLWRFALGTLVAGGVWGIAGLVMFTMEHHGQLAALTIVLTGIAAGGVTTLSAVWWVAPAFVLPTMLPLLVQFLLQGTPLAWLLAVLVVLFLVLVMVISNRLYRFISDNLELRLTMASREQQLRESESRYRTIFRHSPLGVMHFDRHGRVLDCNARCLAILGIRRSRLLGLNLLEQVEDPRVVRAVSDALENGSGVFEGEYRALASGKTTPLRAFYNAMRDADDRVTGGVAIIEDFTERKRAEATIHRQAYFDPLTDLPNRRLLIESLETAIATRRGSAGQGLVIFLDLDRFKMINDSLGHAIGDELLRQVAARLRACLEEDDMAARLSGDEFVVLVPRLSRADPAGDGAGLLALAEARASDLLAAVRQPYDLDGRRISVTPSIGYTLFPFGDEAVGDVLRHADTAMYQAKALGRARICHFEPAMQARVAWRLEMEQALRRALLAGELALHYQPQVDEREHLVGVEALMRWTHPDHGVVSPGVFIAIAEESDLIVELETWMLDTCCALLARQPEACLPRLSVNISARHFAQPEFVETLMRLFEAHRVDPGRLTVELTESIMIDSLDAAAERMRALKALGARIALDDFGTGFSSLSYLKRLPLDELKIDRSFVSDIETDASDAAIVETVLAMARHLKLAVVAEGVENAAQLTFLAARGCRCFQGFHFYRPMPEPALARLLGERVQVPPPA
ncbi:EAL domain-containing protein [Halomonas sp. M4R5S39]|uniref:EAL domain-containing protein n=1 Tax=Halomonas kalidii TaxID=3043293 RepID=UPI0024A92FCE|nr:EAL domain-containing protein [Halomonas kalidii]MDI5983269.1 EAL domain-containing protein [Halomonas kalidii]